MALLALLPVLLAVALLVRVTMGSPVLFRQMRPGQHGVPFSILKFRTMRVATDDLESPQDRMTPTGRWLRHTSLDELPELLNVLKGDMSLVGPRPLLMQYLGLYSPGQARRHEVRPGITGLAQINGRNAVSWERRFAFDVEYVERCSLSLDAQNHFQNGCRRPETARRLRANRRITVLRIDAGRLHRWTRSFSLATVKTRALRMRT